MDRKNKICGTIFFVILSLIPFLASIFTQDLDYAGIPITKYFQYLMYWLGGSCLFLIILIWVEEKSYKIWAVIYLILFYFASLYVAHKDIGFFFFIPILLLFIIIYYFIRKVFWNVFIIVILYFILFAILYLCHIDKKFILVLSFIMFSIYLRTFHIKLVAYLGKNISTAFDLNGNSSIDDIVKSTYLIITIMIYFFGTNLLVSNISTGLLIGWLTYDTNWNNLKP